MDNMHNLLLRTLASLVTRRGALAILTYHRVLKDDERMIDDVCESQFYEQMQRVKKCFNILPLGDAVRLLSSGKLPARTIAITFDDGYRDNYTTARPILASLDIPATCFVSTGFLDGSIMWNDRVIESVRAAEGPVIDLTELGLKKYPASNVDEKKQSVGVLLEDIKYLPLQQRMQKAVEISKYLNATIPENVMMSPDEVKQMHDEGWTIGAHTVTHPILGTLGREEAKKEMSEGKDYLERLIGAPVDLFAYPNGRPDTDYRHETIDVVKELGFKAAVSTAHGTSHTNNYDLFQLPRICPWDKNSLKFAVRLIKTYAQKDFAKVT